MNEADFLDLLRALPLHPGALGLVDDAGRLTGNLVVTTDTLVEGVHYLPDDPPGDVAWKLVAVNLSDLAAKGVRPVAVLLNYGLSDEGWDRAFVAGFHAALRAFDTELLGGDTVSFPPGAPRVLTLTAFGEGGGVARGGARAGDALWVTGTIGRAGRGLAGDPAHRDAYRRPQPRIAEGIALAPQVHAMMDVSDGLLIDAARMAAASGLAVTVALDRVPVAGEPLAAVTAGDDYELLFALPPGAEPPVAAARIGAFAAGSGLTLTDNGVATPLPGRLGWLHGAS